MATAAARSSVAGQRVPPDARLVVVLQEADEPRLVAAGRRGRPTRRVPRPGPRGPPNEASTTYRRTQYGDPNLHVVSPQVGQAPPDEALQPGVIAVASSWPTGLRSQTPISRTASTRAGVSSQAERRHIGHRHPLPGGPRLLAQPDRGVDLVDHRPVRPPGRIVRPLALLIDHVVAIRSLPPRVRKLQRTRGSRMRRHPAGVVPADDGAHHPDG